MAGVPPALAEALRDRYTLERELGRGGMASVYLAHDLRHDRLVALKVLHSELAQALGPERFQREIKLAARLQHPHILSVYDSGESAGQFWFTMPYVEGESLRARLARERQLPIEDAVRIAREAADALDYAHRHGVIHRDIKPENILLTEEHALVADFGIARALEPGRRGSGEEERLTGTGMSMGTPAYMSPEQAAGERSLNARTDIYSLAVVLYEMLAGEPPYTGPTAQAIMARRVSEPAPSVLRLRPEVPDSIAGALRRALLTVPADRFSRAAEFGRALGTPTGAATVPTQPADATRVASVRERDGGRPRLSRTLLLGLGFLLGLGVLFGWLRSRGPREPISGTLPTRLAVLPFETEGDSNDRIFAAGMAEEITTRLARVPGLSLMARSSALQYPRSGQTAPQFGQTLRVDYVLDGTIRSLAAPSGPKRLRITPELIRVSDGTQIWGEPYDGTTSDVFRLQSDVAEQVAVALGGKLGSAQLGTRGAPTRDLEAYRLYTLGRAEWSRRTPNGLKRAADYFEQAIAHDSTFARAWSGLADSYALFPYYIASARLPNDSIYARAKSAALRAIALDSTLAEPHASLNQILRYGYWDWTGSEREIKRAIQLDPDYATAHQWYGEHLLDLGRLPEALEEARISVQLDPLSRATQNCLGVILWFMGRSDEAIQVLRQAIARDSSLGPPWFSLYEIYVTTGRSEQALQLLRSRHDNPAFSYEFLRARENPAARVAALRRLRSGIKVPRSSAVRARFYAMLGDPESAFKELQKALAVRDGNLEWVKVDPAFASLRGDPRFTEIVKEIGLSP
jgi:TolB-like protein/tetratricopeptide (TPR) repeat protein